MIKNINKNKRVWNDKFIPVFYQYIMEDVIILILITMPRFQKYI